MPRLEVSIAASVNYNAATAPKIFGLTNYWEIATGLARERKGGRERGSNNDAHRGIGVTLNWVLLSKSH